jgi:uncharacterized small protein (DUF1192 family)
MDPDELPKKLPAIAIGDNLDAISLAELEHRIQALESEISRIRDEIRKKQATRSAADALFRN